MRNSTVHVIVYFISYNGKQGWIHGHQLRMGGQGRICAFSHFSTHAYGRTDGQTKPLIELRVRNLKTWAVKSYMNLKHVEAQQIFHQQKDL